MLSQGDCSSCNVVKRVVWLAMWICAWAHLGLHVCRPKVTNLRCHSLHAFHLIFETRFFTGLGNTKKCRLLGAPGYTVYPSLAQLWHSKHASPCLAFLDMGSRHQTQSRSCLLGILPALTQAQSSIVFFKLTLVPLRKVEAIYRRVNHSIMGTNSYVPIRIYTRMCKNQNTFPDVCIVLR